MPSHLFFSMKKYTLGHCLKLIDSSSVTGSGVDKIIGLSVNVREKRGGGERGEQNSIQNLPLKMQQPSRPTL